MQEPAPSESGASTTGPTVELLPMIMPVTGSTQPALGAELLVPPQPQPQLLVQQLPQELPQPLKSNVNDSESNGDSSSSGSMAPTSQPTARETIGRSNLKRPMDEATIRRSKRRRIYISGPGSSLIASGSRPPGPFDVIIIDDDVSTPVPLGASDVNTLTQRQNLLAQSIPLERPPKIEISDLIKPV